MNYELKTHHSNILDRDMSFGIYGHAGKIMLAFASQDGKNNNFADFGMIEQLSPWIDAGKIRVITPDSIDEESWSDKDGDPGHRAYMQEKWFHYICEELIPLIRYETGNFDPMMTTGCSMGGFHAGNFALRRPDLFDGCIALSGFYKANLFFGNYMDANLYANSPCDCLRNMPADHPYISLYNERNLIFCIGQGAWEWDLLPSNRELAQIFEEKGIHAWFDFWGFDVNHDWVWWKKMIVYFMEILMPLA